MVAFASAARRFAPCLTGKGKPSIYTTQWYSLPSWSDMPLSAQRVFKTKWFNKAAKAAGISDAELHNAARQLMQELGDDLGGNVWKKRLDQNRKRGIVLNRAGRCWFFVFLFAKSDRDNIDAPELAAFRKLASDFGRCAGADLDRLVELKELVEICHD